jgi:hypothetical protein
MVDFFIETSIDKLIGLLREKKRVKLSEAATTLKVTQKKIDEWVFMLEDRGIVDLKYPILGEPEIVLKHEVSEEALAPRKPVKVETRIIPGKPIKKEELPVFKPSNVRASYEEEPEKQEGYENVVEELKSLESRISNMASKRSDEASPTNLYITEKLKFLEDKLHELSQNREETETEKIILEKLGKIENRLNAMSKKVNKEESINELKEREKKVKIKGTDDV